MIRYAVSDDIEILKKYEHCISEAELKNCIGLSRVLLMFENGAFAGWLRFGLFWDNTPFMNMLYILDGFRGRGCGSRLVGFWENEMLAMGYKKVMTSTLSNENAQFFYQNG